MSRQKVAFPLPTQVYTVPGFCMRCFLLEDTVCSFSEYCCQFKACWYTCALECTQLYLKYRYCAHWTGSGLESASTLLLLDSTGSVNLCQSWEAKMILLLLMTTSLSVWAVICSLHLKISYLKADCLQRVAFFPVSLMQFLKHVMHQELVYCTLDISEMRVNMYLILKVVLLVWGAHPRRNGIAVTELVYCSLHSLRYILCPSAIESVTLCNNWFLKYSTSLFLKHCKLFIS